MFSCLTIINNATVNTGVHVPFQITLLDFIRYTARSRIAESYCNCIFCFLKNLHSVISIVGSPTDIPTNSIRGFPFLHTLPSMCYL